MKSGASVPLLGVSPPLQHAPRAGMQGGPMPSHSSVSSGQRGLPGRTSPVPGDRRGSVTAASLRVGRHQVGTDIHQVQHEMLFMGSSMG